MTEKTQRRRFTAECKRRILAEADKCKKPGELGALLWREGLYSSPVANWRVARDRDGKAGLEPKKRGPKAKAKTDDKDRRIPSADEPGASAGRLTTAPGPRRLGVRRRRPPPD